MGLNKITIPKCILLLATFVFSAFTNASTLTLTVLRDIPIMNNDPVGNENWTAFHFSMKEPGVPRDGFGSSESCTIHLHSPAPIQTFPAGKYSITSDQITGPDLWINSWKRIITHENTSMPASISISCQKRSLLNPLSNKYINSILSNHFVLN